MAYIISPWLLWWDDDGGDGDGVSSSQYNYKAGRVKSSFQNKQSRSGCCGLTDPCIVCQNHHSPITFVWNTFSLDWLPHCLTASLLVSETFSWPGPAVLLVSVRVVRTDTTRNSPQTLSTFEIGLQLWEREFSIWVVRDSSSLEKFQWKLEDNLTHSVSIIRLGSLF